MAMETKTLIKAIKNYNPHITHITLSTIFTKLYVGDGERFNVINAGPPGCGKSYSSTELLKKLDLGTDIFIDNNTTNRGFFDLIVNYPTYDFVLDECSELLRKKGTQDAIKLLMEGKEIAWVKMKSYEASPIFSGSFIFNVNQELQDSLIDRCFVNHTLMNKKMALDFVDYFMDDKVEEDVKSEKEFIAYLKKLISNKKEVKLSKEDITYVKEFVKRQIELNDENLGYSRRIIIRMVSYFKRVKKLFGALDDEVKLFIEPYASTYIENKRTPTLIETILGDAKIEKPELVRLVASEAGYSERHARRIVDEELIKGTLKQFGRMVYV